MDPNIFALVIAKDWTSGHAIRDEQNSSKFVDKDYDIQGDEHNIPRLELRFDSNLPKSPTREWHFGTSPEFSDVLVFPNSAREARYKHNFSLSITSKFKIQLHQISPDNVVSLTNQLEGYGYESPLHSSMTTSTYDHTLESGKSMIIRVAPWKEQAWARVVVRVEDKLTDQWATYEIVFPNHTQNFTEDYRNNLMEWVGEDAECDDSNSIGGLTTTTTTSASQRPLGSLPVFRREIGRGGYGLVELWVDLQRGDMAAMKTLHEGLSCEGLDDFNREIELMINFKHMHIIKLYRFELKPRPRIIMPYYRLGNIGRHKLRLDQYVLAFQQLLEGIRYLHTCHVAHRDLKPENILVDSLDPIHIVISDFGLAKLAVSTHMKSIVGTCWYRPPEMFSYTDPNRGYHFDAVDIWSAGVIMLKWLNVLPKYRVCPNGGEREWTHGWINAVLSEFSSCRQKQATNGIDTRILDILGHMLVQDARSRYTADKCLELGYRSRLFTRPQSSYHIAPSIDSNMGGSHSSATYLRTDSRIHTNTVLTELRTQQQVNNGRVLRPRGPDGRALRRVTSRAISKKSISRFTRQSAKDIIMRWATVSKYLGGIVEGP